MTEHDKSELADGRPPEGRSAAAIGLLEDIRAALATVTLPLAVPSANAARAGLQGALAQLDDYILPRYRSLEAPLLAVVGGSTGAGKSTLVNSLVGHPVTRAGAIRPTTRQPLLLHNPSDVAWFRGQRIFPGLSRIHGTQAAGTPAGATKGEWSGADSDVTSAPSTAALDAEVTSLVLLGDSAIPPGIALLDAPDVDSVSDGNRRLARQLLAAADLWLFVTTANRYADAVPWRLLLDAAGRDITVAVVLDRVPPDAEEEVIADLRAMLEREGLGGSMLFVIEETQLDGKGLIPSGEVGPVERWLRGIADDAAGRSAIARRTLHGAVRSLSGKVDEVAHAASEQDEAGAALTRYVREAYEAAAGRILEATRDGSLLRGEVLARWQDFVGTGEFFRALEQNIGRMRDRVGAFFRGEPAPAVRVEAAIETGLHAVILDEAANAAEESDRRWRADPAGRQLLGADDLSVPSPDLDQRVSAEIRAWQAALMELIRTEGQGKRTQARWLSFGINGLGTALMIVVFSMTAGLTGLELGVAGGTAIVGQKLLEAIFGEEAVRRLAQKARADLQARCRRLLEVDQERFHTRLSQAFGDAGPGAASVLAKQAAALRKLGVSA